jgi:hypothetical protein
MKGTHWGIYDKRFQKIASNPIDYPCLYKKRFEAERTKKRWNKIKKNNFKVVKITLTYEI